MNVTTRHDVTVLQYAYPYPKFENGNLRKVWEQTIISQKGEHSPKLAKVHLSEFQKKYNHRHGWVCNDGHEGVFQDTDGKWYAYRHQAQYK